MKAKATKWEFLGRFVLAEVANNIRRGWAVDLDMAIAEEAVKNGLASVSQYDPKKHGDVPGLEFGDDYWTFETDNQ